MRTLDAHIREDRLTKIRKGQLEPRPFHVDEMQAWREGRNGRRSIIVALGGVFTLVAAMAYLNQEIPPAGKSVAAMTTGAQ